MDKELTTSEAAEGLNESPRLVRLWCQQGRFPNARLVAHPRGDYYVIPTTDLTGFVKPKPGPKPKHPADTTRDLNAAFRKATDAERKPAKRRGRKAA